MDGGGDGSDDGTGKEKQGDDDGNDANIDNNDSYVRSHGDDVGLDAFMMLIVMMTGNRQ